MKYLMVICAVFAVFLLSGCTTFSVPTMTYEDEQGRKKVAYARYSYLLQNKSLVVGKDGEKIDVNFNTSSDPAIEALKIGAGIYTSGLEAGAKAAGAIKEE